MAISISTPDYGIKVGSTLPAFRAQLVDGEYTAVPLAGATLRFVMRLQGSGTVKVNAAAAIEDAAEGRMRYDWQAADVDTAGIYEAEVHADYGGGQVLKFPSQGYCIIDIDPAVV